MRFLLSLFAGLLLVPSAFAHSEGLSFERRIGDILIDIGFGDDMPADGSTLTYSFDLFNVAKPEAYAFEPFTQVRVRILRDREELLNKVLPNNGSNVPSVSFTYPQAGDYSLTASYEREGKDAVAAAFGYRVLEKPAPSTEPMKTHPLFDTALILVTAAAYAAALWRSRA